MSQEVQLDPKIAEQFRRWEKPLPSIKTHGTPEDIAAGMVKLMPTSWRMEGNKLIGETQMGTLVNYLPTDVILLGTDTSGLPILKKII